MMQAMPALITVQISVEPCTSSIESKAYSTLMQLWRLLLLPKDDRTQDSPMNPSDRHSGAQNNITAIITNLHAVLDEDVTEYCESRSRMFHTDLRLISSKTRCTPNILELHHNPCTMSVRFLIPSLSPFPFSVRSWVRSDICSTSKLM